ncbi:MAG TPA: DUF1570 domain-containing protein [Phycisphaerales bacterium]|nr:DUF1570 domain-containing protein [Phycisphaerales bacterium]
MRLVLILTTMLIAQSWYDQTPIIKTKHWELRTDLPQEDIQSVGELLDTCYEVYRNYLSNLPQVRNEKLEAWVFANRQDYLETVQSKTRGDSGVVASTSGMFIDTGGQQVLAVDASGGWASFEQTTKNEAFHQFEYSRFRQKLKPWLNEGLAEYFEHSAYINGVIILDQPAEGDIKKLKQAIQSKTVVPFADFMQTNNQEWEQGMKRNTLQYTQAWSMVQFLVHGEGGKHASEMDTYLKLLQEGMSSEEAFGKAFDTSGLATYVIQPQNGKGFLAFQNAWMDYIEQLKPGATIPTAQRLAYFASGVLELFRLGRTMPINLEELATELEAIKFNGQVRVGGETVTFDAAAVDTYVVPMDSLVTTQPTFMLDPKGQLPGLSTDGLKPKDLRIKWGGTPQSPTWEIVLK